MTLYFILSPSPIHRPAALNTSTHKSAGKSPQFSRVSFATNYSAQMFKEMIWPFSEHIPELHILTRNERAWGLVPQTRKSDSIERRH